MMASQDVKDYGIRNDISLLHEVSDDLAYCIILSIIDSAKAATQISMENKIPLSSTYKKLKKLQKCGLVRIERISIDATGKKALLYKSKITKIEFKMEREGLIASIGYSSAFT
jgi:predicted transcriptional regulator